MSTAQKAIGTGFGASTTAAVVIQGQDLTGKVAIVTGGYSGIGLVTARTLAGAGARVVIPVRDHAKAHKALKPYPELAVEFINLMDPASVDAFADRFLASEQALHILILECREERPEARKAGEPHVSGRDMGTRD